MLDQLKKVPRVRMRNGLLVVETRGASRSNILHMLARKMGFALELGNFEDTPVTLTLTESTLDTVISSLLVGIEYRAEHVTDPVTQEVILVRLSVGSHTKIGTNASPESANKQHRFQSQIRDRLRERFRKLSPTKPASSLAASKASDDQIAAHSNLFSDDATIRTEAVNSIPLFDEWVHEIERIAVDDPSPAVRSAAVQRIEELPRLKALDVLHRVLLDEEPTVVLDAIKILEYLGNLRTVGKFQVLAKEHPDSRVREAAAAAIEQLT